MIDGAQGACPSVLYAGAELPATSPEELAQLAVRQHAPGSASVAVQGSLLNAMGSGIPGPSGISGHRAGKDWALDLRVSKVIQPHEHELLIHCLDERHGIGALHHFTIDPASGMLRCSTTISNLGKEVFDLDWCAALCLPFDPKLDRFMSFTGRWANEFQIEEIPAFHGSILRENKAGRTSHDVFPGGILTHAATSEDQGPAIGFHFAWSGNHRLRIDRHSDGQCFVQMGEMGFPGEFRLAPGESYTTPEFLVAFSHSGLNGISQAFHTYLCASVLDARALSRPRPVHFNTWEAVYFGHDEATLIALAEAAGDVGAERFVLDDGWFGARRHDAAGLGDWWVSKEVYPQGLGPLVSRVRQLGMEFGLWFEPEMVNPDSDLYRAHPEWVLQADGIEPVPFRNQLTLDLTRKEVCDYLFDKISALVSEYAIDYIKWDMNRDTSHPASGGRAVMHRQTHALYGLLERLREAHPALEIESCSSGGGRADFAILRHTDRIWTSDNNDARERQAIQRGASYFFPLRVLGSHVGPKHCHITGRRLSMELRVASAVFGHMGLELDLRQESERDLAILKQGIALYKTHRNLIHSGRFVRLASPQGTNLVGTVAADRSEALFSYAKLENTVDTQPQRIHLAGLDAEMRYRLRMIWPLHNPSISTPSMVDTADLQGKGTAVSGAALMGHGLQPPLTFPETAMFFHLQASE